MWRSLKFFLLFLTLSLWAESQEIWLFCQDFYSFGKKEAFESLAKLRLEQIKQLASKDVPPMLTLQVKGDPEYVSLVPIGSFSKMEEFFALEGRLQAKVGAEVWKKQQMAFNSTLNFQLYSLQRFLPACSCIPKEGNTSLQNLPHVHYFIYSLEPGQQSAFEALLERKAREHTEKKTGACWRVWKTLLGVDVPKYVLAIFALTEEKLVEAVAKVDIVDPEIEKIMRLERDGKALFRSDLSYLP